MRPSRDGAHALPIVVIAWGLLAGCNDLAGLGGLAFAAPEAGGDGGGGGNGGNGGGGSDGGGGSGGDGGCAANGTSTVVDSFEDGVLSSVWLTYGDPVETNGSLLLPLVETGIYYSGATTPYAYDLRGCDVQLRVAQAPNQTTGTEMFGGVVADTENGTWFLISDGRIRIILRERGMAQTMDDRAFDPTQHQVLRLEERRGLLTFLSSPDGQLWTTHNAFASPPWLDVVAITLEGGTYMATVAPGEARWDDVNVAQ